MPDGNFVKIDRKILSWGWYTDISTKCLFLHCILRANWKPGEWRGIRYERGQFISSLAQLSQQTGLTVQQVRTALKHLESTGEITKQTTSKFTVITVKNYDLYQSDNRVPNNPATNGQQGANKQATSSQQQYKKGKNNKEGKKEYICAEPLQASTPEPEEPAVISLPLNDKTWYSITQKQVDEWSGLYPAVDVMQELRKMVGWLDANTSNRKTRRGIKSFVNRWLSKEQDRGGSRQRQQAYQPPAPSTRQPEQDEETRRFIEASEALTDAFVRGEIT